MQIDSIVITHPDKIVFPELKITKAMVADYYHKVAKHMLPYLKGRPLTLRQYPHGIDKEGFYHKHASESYPDFIHRVIVPMVTTADKMTMLIASSVRDLVYMAEQNTIEFHTGLARIDHIELPDQIILDFDPSDDDFEKVRAAVLLTKQILEQKKLMPFVKTTGSRGLHVHIPLRPHMHFKDVKKESHELAEFIHSQSQDITTLEQRKEKRGNKVFIDYLRNDYNMTAIVPYSLRANKYAGVATPLFWHEVEDKKLNAHTYNISNVLKRLDEIEDPWHHFK